MTSPRSLLAGLALLASVIAGNPAQATVLFAHPFGPAPAIVSFCTSCGGFFQMWDRFSLSSAANVTQVEALLGIRDVPSIEYSIWDTNLTTKLFAQTIAIGDLVTTALGGSAFDVVADISGLHLAAGNYALSIYSSAITGVLGWYENGEPGSSFLTNGQAGTGRQMSFRLLGDVRTAAVPEPSALALFGLALLGLRNARKRSA